MSEIQNCRGCGRKYIAFREAEICDDCDPSEPAEVYLRKQDAGTLNACWVLCSRGDAGAVLFTPFTPNVDL